MRNPSWFSLINWYANVRQLNANSKMWKCMYARAHSCSFHYILFIIIIVICKLRYRRTTTYPIIWNHRYFNFWFMNSQFVMWLWMDLPLRVFRIIHITIREIKMLSEKKNKLRETNEWDLFCLEILFHFSAWSFWHRLKFNICIVCITQHCSNNARTEYIETSSAMFSWKMCHTLTHSIQLCHQIYYHMMYSTYDIRLISSIYRWCYENSSEPNRI